MQLRKALTRALYYPYWFVELFTWAKSFRQNPIIENHCNHANVVPQPDFQRDFQITHLLRWST